MIILFLTCADQAEAGRITNSLLQKRLIACGRQMPVASTFVWEGKIQQAKEVILMMETVESRFDRIEAEVRKLHSYQTFVLTAVPVTRQSKGVNGWLQQSMG